MADKEKPNDEWEENHRGDEPLVDDKRKKPIPCSVYYVLFALIPIITSISGNNFL